MVTQVLFAHRGAAVISFTPAPLLPFSPAAVRRRPSAVGRPSSAVVAHSAKINMELP